jgi:signal transduction histidine kinase
MSTDRASDHRTKTASSDRRISELSILHEVSRALQKTVDEERALHIILAGVTAGWGLGFNRAFILLLDEKTQVLRGRLAIGPETPEEAFGIWQDLGERHESLGDLLHSILIGEIKKDKWINDLVARLEIPLHDGTNPLIRILRSHEAGQSSQGMFLPHGFPVSRDMARLLGTEDFAVAPLFLGNTDLGILIADNAITHAPIDEDHLGLLDIYAQEASTAIQNTRLIQRLTDQIKISEDQNVILRASQQQLLEVERLSTMGRLATLLAYRVRSPLASIGGFARRLGRTMPPEDARRNEVEIMISEVTRLERLVAEVLAYRRISRPEFKPTDVNALIRSVLITMHDEIQRNGVRTMLRQQPDLPLACLDQLQVRQALMNLFTNAVEAMPAGGVLTVSTSANGEFLDIDVSDTGTGISKQNWKKLFKPFFTTKTTGTGLGLAIVSQVVETHKGALSFESTEGEGTRLHLRLALHPETRGNEPSGVPAAPLEGK